jgi:hypothetical protein
MLLPVRIGFELPANSLLMLPVCRHSFPGYRGRTRRLLKCAAQLSDFLQLLGPALLGQVEIIPQGVFGDPDDLCYLFVQQTTRFETDDIQCIRRCTRGVK